MPRIIAIIGFVCFGAGCATHPDEWRTQDTVLYGATMAVLAADWNYTRRIPENPRVYEKGYVARSFLGRYPDDRDVALYFGTIMLSQYFIARALPHRWRTAWFGWEIAAHGWAIRQTCQTPVC